MVVVTVQVIALVPRDFGERRQQANAELGVLRVAPCFHGLAGAGIVDGAGDVAVSRAARKRVECLLVLRAIVSKNSDGTNGDHR